MFVWKKKIVRLFFFLFYLCSIDANAVEGFYTVNDFPIGGVSKETASKVLDRTGRFGDTCPLIPISKEFGVTALHCIKNEAVFKFSHHFRDDSGSIQKFIRDTSNQVELTGGTFPFIFEVLIQSNKWSHNDKVIFMESYQSDWAIVKNKSDVCFSNRNNPIATGETIIFSGSPALTFRSRHPSPGNELRLSIGETVLSMKGNSYFESMDESTQTLLNETVGKLVADKILILSDADIFHENSGGPITDAQGKLVGVAVAGIVPPGDENRYKYLKNSALGISIEAIKNHIVRLGKDPNIYFNCED